MNESSLGREAAEAMWHADFRDVMPLPSLRGLPLALTAVRALELWSDLATGVKRPAKLKPSERIDVMDECLDVVVPEPDHPAGFRFTGMSVAQLRAALKAAVEYSSEHEQFENVFHSAQALAMRHAARQRVGRRVELACFFQHSLWIPEQASSQTIRSLPLSLDALSEAADPERRKFRRNQLLVEVLETRMLAMRNFPTRGRRLPIGRRGSSDPWLTAWMNWRLIPQMHKPDSDGYHEYQLALPSLETSYFSDHFPVRNLFAHLRFSEFRDPYGRRVLLLEEVQSDWMRDLRRQRSNHPLHARRIAKGRHGVTVPASVPELPIEKYWLDVAMKALIDVASNRKIDIIAWVPGKIQTELNVGLPLSVTQRLYDCQVPDRLAEHLGWENVRSIHVDYPTYRRDVVIRHRDEGWVLFRPDLDAVVSAFVPDWETILKLHRIQARPTVELLPAFQVFSNNDEGAQRLPDIDDFDPLPE